MFTNATHKKKNAWNWQETKRCCGILSGSGVPECQFLFLLVSNQIMVATNKKTAFISLCLAEGNQMYHTILYHWCIIHKMQVGK